MCVTEKAKKVERCERCISAGHKSEECLKTIEAAVLALTQSSRERSTAPPYAEILTGGGAP